MREILIRSRVVDPELVGPRSLRGRLDPLRVKDAGRQAQERMDVAIVEQSAADHFAGAAFEEDVVWHDDRRAAVNVQNRLDVLDEVELLVAGCRPEVIAHDGQRLTF